MRTRYLPGGVIPKNVKEVRVLWYDTPDLLALGALPIKPAPVGSLNDFVRWQAINHSQYAEAGSDLYLEIGCEWSPWAQQIVLEIRSRLDLCSLIVSMGRRMSHLGRSTIVILWN